MGGGAPTPPPPPPPPLPPPPPEDRKREEERARKAVEDDLKVMGREGEGEGGVLLEVGGRKEGMKGWWVGGFTFFLILRISFFPSFLSFLKTFSLIFYCFSLCGDGNGFW